MKLLLRAFYAIVLVGMGCIAPCASAQTQSFSFGNGLGTLTYTAVGDTEFCTGLHGFEAQFTDWSFTNFTYTDANNTTQQISGFTSYVEVCLAHKEAARPLPLAVQLPLMRAVMQL